MDERMEYDEWMAAIDGVAIRLKSANCGHPAPPCNLTLDRHLQLLARVPLRFAQRWLSLFQAGGLIRGAKRFRFCDNPGDPAWPAFARSDQFASRCSSGVDFVTGATIDVTGGN